MYMLFALAKSKSNVRYFILVYYQGLMSLFKFSFTKLASFGKAIHPQDVPKHAPRLSKLDLSYVFRVNHSCVCTDRI